MSTVCLLTLAFLLCPGLGSSVSRRGITLNFNPLTVWLIQTVEEVLYPQVKKAVTGLLVKKEPSLHLYQPEEKVEEK